MLRGMSWRQFREWIQFREIEPLSGERADIAAGVIASTIANVHRDPKRSRPAKIKDFIVEYGKSEPRSTGPKKPMDQESWERAKAVGYALAGVMKHA